VAGILLEVFMLLVVLGVLAALAYDDRRTRRIREAEDRAAEDEAVRNADAEP
jgi:hypothetical protein